MCSIIIHTNVIIEPRLSAPVVLAALSERKLPSMEIMRVLVNMHGQNSHLVSVIIPSASEHQLTEPRITFRLICSALQDTGAAGAN